MRRTHGSRVSNENALWWFGDFEINFILNLNTFSNANVHCGSVPFEQLAVGGRNWWATLWSVVGEKYVFGIIATAFKRGDSEKYVFHYTWSMVRKFKSVAKSERNEDTSGSRIFLLMLMIFSKKKTNSY